mgnify:CR=1 FL=1
MHRLKSSNRERILGILNKVSLFKTLTEAEIEHLYMQNNDFYRTDYGEVFVREGAVESFFYILLAGEVEIYKNDEPSHIICQLSPGNFLGENSYFNRRPRNANVRAKGECVLMKIDADTVRLMPLEVRDKIKDKIILELVQRVGNMNESQLGLVDEVRQAQQQIEKLEKQMKRILDEYPYIRMRFT